MCDLFDLSVFYCRVYILVYIPLIYYSHQCSVVVGDLNGFQLCWLYKKQFLC
jgi:hypothetical protein